MNEKLGITINADTKAKTKAVRITRGLAPASHEPPMIRITGYMSKPLPPSNEVNKKEMNVATNKRAATAGKRLHLIAIIGRTTKKISLSLIVAEKNVSGRQSLPAHCKYAAPLSKVPEK